MPQQVPHLSTAFAYVLIMWWLKFYPVSIRLIRMNFGLFRIFAIGRLSTFWLGSPELYNGLAWTNFLSTIASHRTLWKSSHWMASFAPCWSWKIKSYLIFCANSMAIGADVTQIGSDVLCLHFNGRYKFMQYHLHGHNCMHRTSPPPLSWSSMHSSERSSHLRSEFHQKMNSLRYFVVNANKRTHVIVTAISRLCKETEVDVKNMWYWHSVVVLTVVIVFVVVK